MTIKTRTNPDPPSQLRLPSVRPYPQLPLNRLPQRLGPRRTPPPALNPPIPPHQKLLEIPLHPLQPQHARLLPLHPLPQRIRPVAINVQLPQHGKRDAVVDFAELLDLVVGARVLG